MANVLEAKTDLKILRPVHDVFEAIVDPDIMSRYFISKGNRRMEEGKTVHWKFDDVGAELDVKIKKIRNDGSISFFWSASGVEALVEINVEPVS